MRKGVLLVGLVSLVLLVQLVFVGDSFAQANQGDKAEKEAEQAIEELREGGYEEGARASNRLLGLGKLATPFLVKAIKTKRFSEHFRGSCIDILMLIQDKESVEPLIEVYRDESEISGIRKEALYALGKIGGPEIRPVLLEGLERKEAILRKGAISGIWGLVGRKVVEFPVDAVVAIAKNDPNVGIRAYATASLRLGGEKAVQPLLELMNDENKDVRLKTCWSLGLIGDRRAVEPLIAKLSAKLNDSEYYERSAAIEALGNIGDRRAVEPLIEILNVKDAHSRDAAIALAKIGDKRAVEPLAMAIQEEAKIFGAPSNHLLNAYKKLTGEEYEPKDGGSK